MLQDVWYLAGPLHQTPKCPLHPSHEATGTGGGEITGEENLKSHRNSCDILQSHQPQVEIDQMSGSWEVPTSHISPTLIIFEGIQLSYTHYFMLWIHPTYEDLRVTTRIITLFCRESIKKTCIFYSYCMGDCRSNLHRDRSSCCQPGVGVQRKTIQICPKKIKLPFPFPTKKNRNPWIRWFFPLFGCWCHFNWKWFVTHKPNQVVTLCDCQGPWLWAKLNGGGSHVFTSSSGTTTTSELAISELSWKDQTHS